MTRAQIRSARIALGMTPRQADVAARRAREMGRMVAKGELSLAKARAILRLLTIREAAVTR